MGSIKDLADKISFRLLATRKHEDYDWLQEELKEAIKPKFQTKKFVKFFLIWYSQQMAIPLSTHYLDRRKHCHFSVLSTESLQTIFLKSSVC